MEAPTAAESDISGRVTGSNGVPLGGVTVRLGGSKTGRAITNADGFYRFTNLQAGGFYTVTPLLANHSFTPAARSFSLNNNVTDAAFDATETAPAENALDTSEFFVRQQYLDFLGREPDQQGFEYWSSQFDLCGGDSDCLRQTRINVSAAFFVEQEFQQTGYFIYRTYKASFGAQATYAQFVQDRGRVIGGANFESSRQQFADEWVTRDPFLQRYPQTMSATDFVNKLYDTAALTPYAAERRQQIAAMNNGKTRSQVLRDVIETQDFKSREYNRAFVLTQYFGYLRRDPEEAGYDFWLNILNNKVPDNYRAMVCAFTTSAEYQQRFSPVVTHANSECGP